MKLCRVERLQQLCSRSVVCGGWSCRISGRRRGAALAQHARGYQTSSDEPVRRNESLWQQRSALLLFDRSEEFRSSQLVTADRLRSCTERPVMVKMLLRDFIEDSLYNPHYGYFSKQAVIFSPDEAFNFNAIRDEPQFNKILGRSYAAFEDRLDEIEYDDTRQLWHTPAEVFSPYYGEAIARYLVANYKLSVYPYEDLVIYEMGAGNGTLMLNVLDYIQRTVPEVYERTKYRVIEVSTPLAKIQSRNLRAVPARSRHEEKVEIINKSIFDWNKYVSTSCYFLALEVFDNFAHDAIRYNESTEEPLQCYVLIDGDGDFFEFYSRTIEPTAARYLHIRDAACSDISPHPLQTRRILRKLKTQLYSTANLTPPEYIPTRLMQFFDILHEYFPKHRLFCSDFHTLPTPVVGCNSPIVQTRFRRRTVPVTSPLVHQGYFDIMFPTPFHVVESIYRAMTGRLTRVISHEHFTRNWADVSQTQTNSGENPLLTWYKNASVMATV